MITQPNDQHCQESFSPFDDDYLKKIKGGVPDHMRSKSDLIDELYCRRKEDKTYLQSLFKAKKQMKRVHLIYSSILVLFLSCSIFYFDSTTISKNESFEEYYSSFKRNNRDINLLMSFVDKDYTIIDKNYNGENITLNTNFLKAVSFIEANNYSAAHSLLKDINNDESEWLDALCLLRLGDHFDAIDLFERIYLKRGLFSNEAKKILEKHYYTYQSKKQ